MKRGVGVSTESKEVSDGREEKGEEVKRWPTLWYPFGALFLERAG